MHFKGGGQGFEKLAFHNNKHETDRIEHWQDTQTHKCNSVFVIDIFFLVS